MPVPCFGESRSLEADEVDEDDAAVDAVFGFPSFPRVFQRTTNFSSPVPGGKPPSVVGREMKAVRPIVSLRI